MNKKWMVLAAAAVVVGVLLVAPCAAMADDQTVPPVVSYATNPQSGVGNSFSAPYQWWKVYLNKGASLAATMAVTSAGDSVYLRLYPPGTTDARQTQALLTSTGSNSWTYVAPQAGDYLFCAFNFSYSDTAYTFTWKRKLAPVVGVPVAPTTMTKGGNYTVWGLLRPRHTAGSYPVRIYRWRHDGTKWVPYGYVWAKAYDYTYNSVAYTKYARSIALPATGWWRLRAYAVGDSAHAPVWSSTYDTVKVE